eukprot:scaffold304691_cov30-Tisochrysis_lutea.AAC.4
MLLRHTLEHAKAIVLAVAKPDADGKASDEQQCKRLHNHSRPAYETAGEANERPEQVGAIAAQPLDLKREDQVVEPRGKGGEGKREGGECRY